MLRRANGFMTEMSHCSPDSPSLNITIGTRAVGLLSTFKKKKKKSGDAHRTSQVSQHTTTVFLAILSGVGILGTRNLVQRGHDKNKIK